MITANTSPETLTLSAASREVIVSRVSRDGDFEAHAQLADGTALPAYGLRGKSWKTQKGAERAARAYLNR